MKKILSILALFVSASSVALSQTAGGAQYVSLVIGVIIIIALIYPAVLMVIRYFKATKAIIEMQVTLNEMRDLMKKKND